MRFFVHQGRALLIAAAVGLGLFAAGCGGRVATSPGKSAQGAAQGESGGLAEESGGFTDGRDGQKYKTAEMPDGKRWMAENLRYNADGSWCYGGDDSNCEKYGRLYSWDMAKTVCPAGWHLPSKEDWDVMTAAAGANVKAAHKKFKSTEGKLAGKALKSASGWDESDNGTVSTDDFGFSALPGGSRSADGVFGYAGKAGLWWTATGFDGGYAAYRGMNYSYDIIDEELTNVDMGLSVRCVADSAQAEPSENGQTLKTAKGSGVKTDDGLISVSYLDDSFLKKYKTYESYDNNSESAQKIAIVPSVPVKDFSWLSVGVSDEDPDEVVYEIKDELYKLNELLPQKPLAVSWTEVGIMSAFGFSYRGGDGQIKYFLGRAANYGEDPKKYDGPDFAISPFFPAAGTKGGPDYKTAKIGSKVWMAENLNRKIGESWCYNNDKSNCAKYGRLYDWNTAKTACPEGWRLPSNKDWTELAAAAGGPEDGGKLLKSTSGWKDDGSGTDDFGFSALPGGGRVAKGSKGIFDMAGKAGYWWTAMESGGDNAVYRAMLYSGDRVSENANGRENGFSVRCVQE